MKAVAGIADRPWNDRPPIRAAYARNDRGMRLLTAPNNDANIAAHKTDEASGWIQAENPKHGRTRGIC